MNAQNRKLVYRAIAKMAKPSGWRHVGSKRGEAIASAMIIAWLLAVMMVGLHQTHRAYENALCAEQAKHGASQERQVTCWQEYGVFVPVE